MEENEEPQHSGDRRTKAAPFLPWVVRGHKSDRYAADEFHVLLSDLNKEGGHVVQDTKVSRCLAPEIS